MYRVGSFGVSETASSTCYSQNAFDLPLGSNGIYMGDRWRSSLLGSSRYIWYPLDFSSGSPTIVHADVWDLDIAAGLCRWLTLICAKPNPAPKVALQRAYLHHHFREAREWDI